MKHWKVRERSPQKSSVLKDIKQPNFFNVPNHWVFIRLASVISDKFDLEIVRLLNIFYIHQQTPCRNTFEMWKMCMKIPSN